METIVLKNASVVTMNAVKKTSVSIRGQHIYRVGSNPTGDEIIDCDGAYLVPGFRDQHLHDFSGFMEHRDDSERLHKVSRSLASQGVTAYMIATFAAPIQDLVEYMKTVKDCMVSELNGIDCARLEGANIEGTFIRRECAGAQPYEYIVTPDEPDAFRVLKSLLKTKVVKLINIAPDFGTSLIQYASSQGAIIGCGHCLATANQLAEGRKHGLKFIVHFTNGAMGHSFKPFDGGGTYEGALTLPLFVEIIPDGYHVDFRYISDIVCRRIQQGRSHEIIAVTDAIFPVLSEIPRVEFNMFSTICVKSHDEGVFVVRGRKDRDGNMVSVPPNTLCSSKLSMDKSFENLLNLFTVSFQGFMIDRDALPLQDAVRYVSRLTSSNQALMQGVSDKTGSIELGKLADLAIMSIEGNPGSYVVRILKTVIGGRVVSFS